MEFNINYKSEYNLDKCLKEEEKMFLIFVCLEVFFEGFLSRDVEEKGIRVFNDRRNIVIFL